MTNVVSRPDNVESFTIGRVRPFLVTSSPTRGENKRCNVHVSADIASTSYRAQLKRKFRTEFPGTTIRVKRHKDKHLWRSAHLADYVKPLRTGDIYFDPTGAVERATKLVDYATALRAELGDGVNSLYWEPSARVLFVVFNRKRFVTDRTVKVESLKSLESNVKELLVKHLGEDAERYVMGVRLGFHVPGGNFVPLDASSYKNSQPGSAWQRLGRNTTLAMLLSAAVPATAVAQNAGQSAPAVSAPNWDAAVNGGSRDGDSSFMFEANYTAPLTYTTGFRLDGAAGGTDEGFQGGLGLHYFRRNPSVGLVGAFGSWATIDPNDSVSQDRDIFETGVESELYVDDLTLVAIGGLQFGDDIDNGLFGELKVEWYATDDLMLSAGGRLDPEREGLAVFGAEYQPAYQAMPGLTLYAEGAVGGNDYEHIFAGMRYYFGAPKSLKDRHRYDTFRSTGQQNSPASQGAIPNADPAAAGGNAGGGGGGGGGCAT